MASSMEISDVRPKWKLPQGHACNDLEKDGTVVIPGTP